MDLSKAISERLVRQRMKEAATPKKYYKEVEDILNHRLASYETNVYVNDLELVSETPEAVVFKVEYTVDVKIPIVDPEDHSTYYEYDNEYREQTVVLDKKGMSEGKSMNEDFDPMFDEDLKKYKGKMLKELLKALDGRVRINIDLYKSVSHYGTAGYGGRCNGVGWEYADLIIQDIKAGDGKLVDVYAVVQ